MAFFYGGKMKILLRIIVVVVIIQSILGCNNAKDEKLIIGLIKPSTDHLPVEFGIDENIISANNIEIKYFRSGWETNEAIANERVDVAILPFTYIWKDIEKDIPVKIISFLERESDGIIANKNITKIEDLNGKKIGVLKASTLDILSEMFEDKYDLEMEQIYFRTPMDMAAALKSGEVGALSYYVPSILKFGDDFNIVHWYNNDWENHPCCDIAATESAISNKNQQINKFMVELRKSVIEFNKHENNAINSANKYFKMNKSEFHISSQHQKFVMNLSDEGKKFEKNAIEYMRKLGYMKKNVEIADVYER